MGRLSCMQCAEADTKYRLVAPPEFRCEWPPALSGLNACVGRCAYFVRRGVRVCVYRIELFGNVKRGDSD